METLEQVLEDALVTWQEGNVLLESLPSLNPDHETVRLAVVKLRSVYETAVTRRQIGSSALVSSRATIDDASRILGEVRTRQIGHSGTSTASTTAGHVERTIAQAEALLAQTPPYTTEHDRISSAIVELRQIEAMIDNESDLRQDGMIRRAIVQAQLAIAQASVFPSRHADSRSLSREGAL